MSEKPKKRRRPHGFRRRTAPGAAPGTIRVDPEAPKPVLHVFAWTEKTIEESPLESTAAIRDWLGRGEFVWVNVDGLGDAATISEIGEIFGIHRLALEDVVNVHQRPKVEQYSNHQYIVSRMAAVREHLETEQISIFLGTNYVLTFQERRGDCFDPVRGRLREGKGRIRVGGVDYLAYAILDAIVDGYFPVLESFGERLENLEEEILVRPDGRTLSRVHRVKRELLTLRRSIWPQREAVSSLMRDPSDLVSDETRIYLRDCYDHTIQIMDLLETYRELASGLVDAYMSSVSNRMNEVMKVLTIIATIFIPLTFIAGVYGMNFRWMPELDWWWAYPAVWAVMIAIAVALVVFFARKGWLSSFVPNPRELDPDE